jgi:ribonuclease-3
MASNESNWDMELNNLQQRIGYKFSDKNLLITALTHKSSLRSEEAHNITSHYERLEFLGDSILGFVISEYLFKRFPTMREGPMTKIKSFIVSRDRLAEIGHILRLERIMYMSEDERKRKRNHSSIVSNTVEAIIGAVYLDGGMENARIFILATFKDLVEKLDIEDLIFEDYKSIVQEIVQKERQILPEYKIIKEKGPEHNKTFVVQLSIEGDAISRGSGPSKKRAEQRAAQKAYKILSGRWKTFRRMRRYLDRLKKSNN